MLLANFTCAFFIHGPHYMAAHALKKRVARAGRRVRRFGVRLKDGESLCVSDDEFVGVVDGKSIPIFENFGLMTVRKWSM